MKIAFLAAANSPHTIKWANAFAENNDVAVISLPEDKDNFGELSEKVSVTYLDVPASQGGFKTVSYTHLDSITLIGHARLKRSKPCPAWPQI